MKCAANLKQFGMANVMYADSEDNWYVPIRDQSAWTGNPKYNRLMGDSAADGGFFDSGLMCPAAASDNIVDPDTGKGALPRVYGMNNTLSFFDPPEDFFRRTGVPMPASAVQLTDANYFEVVTGSSSDDANPAWWRAYNELNGHNGGRDAVTYRHPGESVNLQFFDGHVDSLTSDEAYPTYGTPTYARLWFPSRPHFWD